MADGAATVRSTGPGTQEAAIMAAEKEGGGPTHRKGSAGRGGSGRIKRTVEKAGPAGTVVDVDLWGSFFERFWGPAEGGVQSRRLTGGDSQPRARGRRAQSPAGRGTTIGLLCRYV